jgi:large conductance mechanosensitive channel
MWKEFKDFAFKSTVLDLAIAFILGVAFAAIVNSLVKDIIMPVVGLVTGGVDFASLYINLSGKSYASLADAQKAGAATINYGVFINTVITFLIVAFVMFLFVRAYNWRRPPVTGPVSMKPCPYCQTDIPIAAVRCPNCTSQLAAAT